MADAPAPEIEPRRWSLPGWVSLALSLLALFLVVAGARLWLVQNYSTSLPFSDQWDGEGGAILKPWVEGHLPFDNLIRPHNEHRILLTRVLILALFAGNRQWDPQLEMAVNAALYGVSAVLITAGLLQVFGANWRWVVLPLVALYGVLPFGWENTLSGFASQNYFLIVFSLAAIWGMGLHPAGSAAWWVGLLGQALACLSMGSGFLAAVAVLGLLFIRTVKERTSPGWRGWVTAVVCIAVIAVGWSTRTVVPQHAVLRATSFGAFVSAFCRFLAWPWYGQAGWVWPMMFPWALLALQYLWTSPDYWDDGSIRRRRPVELLLAVGGWGLLQVAALAYSRDGHGAPPACRYMDLLAIVPLTNFLAAALLIEKTAWFVREFALLPFLPWLGLVVFGLWGETRKDFQGWLPDHLAEQLRGEENVRGYVSTGDFQRFLADPPPNTVPFPDAKRLAAMLDDPTIRAFLPADVRLPLQVQKTGGQLAFVPDGFEPTLSAVPSVPCWGSYPGGGGTWQGRVGEVGGSSGGLPYLLFRFAGDLGEPGLSFVLSEAAGEQRLDWKPPHVPHEHWRTDYLPRPGKDLRLEAADNRDGKWFAFTAPVEVGGWSYWAGYLLRRGGWVFVVGGVLGIGALAYDLRRWRIARA